MNKLSGTDQLKKTPVIIYIYSLLIHEPITHIQSKLCYIETCLNDKFLEDNFYLVRIEQIAGENIDKINMIIRLKLKVLFRYFCYKLIPRKHF